MMTKKLDPDIKALKQAKRALLGSSSRRMMIANIEYLYDFFVKNPPKDLYKQVQNAASRTGEGK